MLSLIATLSARCEFIRRPMVNLALVVTAIAAMAVAARASDVLRRRIAAPLLFLFLLLTLPRASAAGSWDVLSGWSLGQNPNGAWSYGLKQTPEGSFSLLGCTYSNTFWLRCGAWYPSMQIAGTGIDMWANNNGNGYPVVRWTCPTTGQYDINCKFTGEDGRGVNVFVYFVVAGSTRRTKNITAYQDTAAFASTVSLIAGDPVDFVVVWNGSSGVPADYNWTSISGTIRSAVLDHSVPDTQILTGPPAGGWTSESSLTFSWTGTDSVTTPANMRYAYRLDGGAYGVVSSATSVTLNSVAEGPHTFDVYAVDQAANADPTPASRAFTVDRTAPTVAFVSGLAEGDTIGVDSTRFTFMGTDSLTPAAQLKYAWSSNSGLSWTTPGPITLAVLTGLTDGVRSLTVHCIDLAGNVSPNATRTWHVAAGAPVVMIVAGPAEGGRIGTRDATFRWSGRSASTPKSQLLYRAALDSMPAGTFTRDTSASFSALTAAAHVLHIEAQDRFGHVGALARNFRVDVSPPNTVIASGPTNGGWANSTSVDVSWTGTDDASAADALLYFWRVDSGAYHGPTSDTSATLDSLTEGLHTLSVYAVDEAGNADPTPASLVFRVDVTAPHTLVVFLAVHFRLLTIF